MKKLLIAVAALLALQLGAAAQDLGGFKKLSAEDKALCILSSNLVEHNGQEHDSLNPEAKNPTGKSKKILHDSWGINSAEDLERNLESLAANKTGKSLTALRKLLHENPGKTPSQLVRTLPLSIEEAHDLFIADYLDDKIGDAGALAWNYGRAITIIRWSLAAGYIDEKTARQKARPFAQELQKSYRDFEDFSAHYLMGAFFFFGKTYEAEKRLDFAKSFYGEYKGAFPKNLFKMDKKSGNAACTFDDLQKLLDGFEKFRGDALVSAASEDYLRIADAKYRIGELVDDYAAKLGNTVTEEGMEKYAKYMLSNIDSCEAARKSGGTSVYNSPFYFLFLAERLSSICKFYPQGHEYLKDGVRFFPDEYKGNENYNNFYFCYLILLAHSENEYMEALDIAPKLYGISEDVSGYVHLLCAGCYAQRLSDGLQNRDITGQEAVQCYTNGLAELDKAEKAGYSDSGLKAFFDQFTQILEE